MKPVYIPELEWITEKDIHDAAVDILQKYPSYIDLPASLSGKYHLGETLIVHARRTMHFIEMMCQEMDTNGRERSMLLATALLHDIGKARMIKKDFQHGLYKYTSPTGQWFIDTRYGPRLEGHPEMGRDIIRESSMPKDIKPRMEQMILRHMSHWKDHLHIPITLYDHMIAMADYLASRDTIRLAPFDFKVEEEET